MRSDGAVIVGVAGGTFDRVVLVWAAGEAGARGADLVVCHVRERPGAYHPRVGELEQAGSPEHLVREAASTARTGFPDLAVTTAIGSDRVVPALMRASLDACMLVLGARGDEGTSPRPLGSVAEQIATNARCPVAVVRPPLVPELGDVVVGVDGSSHSDVTLRLARVKPAVRATLEREGTIERLGPEHVHGNVHRAVEAQLSA